MKSLRVKRIFSVVLLASIITVLSSILGPKVEAKSDARAMGFELTGDSWYTAYKMKSDKLYEVKYNKNYFWASNKGVYKCSEITTWNGVYTMYDEVDDKLFVLFCSRLKTTPNLISPSVAKSAVTTNKHMRSIISFSQPSNTPSLSTIEYKATPTNEPSEWTEKVEIQTNTNGLVSNGISVSKTYKDIETKLVSSQNHVTVDFYFTGYDRFYDSVYSGTQYLLSTYYMGINDVSSNLNTKITITFDYLAEFYVNDTGKENYHVSSVKYPNDLNLATTLDMKVGDLVKK